MKTALLALAALVTLATAAQANASETKRSEKLTVSPSRITGRAVVQKEAGAFTVQILSVSSGGSTDMSNTEQLVLTIASLGEMATVETSIVVAESFGFISAKMVKPGFIEVIHNDASAFENGGTPRNPKNPLEVRLLIDARDAIKAVQSNACSEFGECELKTSVKVK